MINSRKIVEMWNRRSVSPTDKHFVLIQGAATELHERICDEFTRQDGNLAGIVKLSEFLKIATEDQVYTVTSHLLPFEEDEMPVVYIDDRNRCIPAPHEAIVDFLYGED